MSQALSPDDIKRIARLARIEIDDAQAQATQTQLNSIFELIATMQAVDTRGIAPMAHAQEVYQRLRMDAVTETDRHAAFQAIAPAVENGLYLVPKVIE
ncbi:MAG TPA: Asp-tRNA(Asn)/Glu-tRNA(Gln) amidotransferase subunit GatC [Thiobacillus sp.]